MSDDRNGPDDDHLGAIDSMIARHVSNLSAVLSPFRRIHNRRTLTVVTAAGADTFAAFGTVPAGRMWNINGIIVMGVDPWTAFAQPAALCVGRAQLDPANATEYLVDVIQPALTAPAAYWWNDDIVWARGNDDVYLAVKKGTAGTVTATLIYDDWDDNAQNPVGL